jgi:tetratricopeptide (TPR) repeat protein
VVGAGASGAIFGLAGALLAALYLGKLPIPKDAIRATMKSLLIFSAYNLFLGLRSGVDNSAHIGGLASGLALGAFLSRHLLEPAEIRQLWRNYSLVLSLVLLGAATYYVRAQHRELTGLKNPYDYLGQSEKGMDAFRRKDYADAVAAFQKLAQLDSKSSEAHFLLGVAYEGAERPDDEISEFQEALRLNPKYAEAEAGLAEAYRAKGMEREADEASHKAAELKGGRKARSHFDPSSSSSTSFTKSTTCPRMANVCFAPPAGSKLTRIGPRCHAGAGHAESGAASSGTPSFASGFFRTGLRRLSCATIAYVFFPSSATPQ